MEPSAKMNFRTSTPPVIQPPPLATKTPIKTPSTLVVVAYSAGTFLLFILEVLFTYLEMAEKHTLFATELLPIGYIIGKVVVPLAVILGICLCFKSNRSPYRFLMCLFQTLVFMLTAKVLTFTTLLLTHRP